MCIKLLYVELILKYRKYVQNTENGVCYTEIQTARLEALQSAFHVCVIKFVIIRDVQQND